MESADKLNAISRRALPACNEAVLYGSTKIATKASSET